MMQPHKKKLIEEYFDTWKRYIALVEMEANTRGIKPKNKQMDAEINRLVAIIKKAGTDYDGEFEQEIRIRTAEYRSKKAHG